MRLKQPSTPNSAKTVPDVVCEILYAEGGPEPIPKLRAECNKRMGKSMDAANFQAHLVRGEQHGKLVVYPGDLCGLPLVLSEPKK